MNEKCDIDEDEDDDGDSKGLIGWRNGLTSYIGYLIYVIHLLDVQFTKC